MITHTVYQQNCLISILFKKKIKICLQENFINLFHFAVEDLDKPIFVTVAVLFFYLIIVYHQNGNKGLSNLRDFIGLKLIFTLGFFRFLSILLIEIIYYFSYSLLISRYFFINQIDYYDSAHQFIFPISSKSIYQTAAFHSLEFYLP